MKPLLILPLLGLAALATPVVPAPAQQAAAQRDWSRSVAMTAEGGFRMGNPDAPVKLVEYGSLTCPHCAHFSKEGVAPLVANHVKSGKVSWEFRNLVLNGVDGIASLLARCAGPRGFFAMTENIYATQEEWIGKVQSISQAEGERLKRLPQPDQFVQVAESSGLLGLAVRAGVTRDQARQCFADKKGAERLTRMSEAAARLGITGTPSFLINGRKVDARQWAELEPLIRRAGG